jgi:hypothetical protein
MTIARGDQIGLWQSLAKPFFPSTRVMWIGIFSRR